MGQIPSVHVPPVYVGPERRVLPDRRDRRDRRKWVERRKGERRNYQEAYATVQLDMSGNEMLDMIAVFKIVEGM